MTPWLLACETRCFKLLLPEMRNTAGQAGLGKDQEFILDTLISANVFA